MADGITRKVDAPYDLPGLPSCNLDRYLGNQFHPPNATWRLLLLQGALLVGANGPGLSNSRAGAWLGGLAWVPPKAKRAPHAEGRPGPTLANAGYIRAPALSCVNAAARRAGPGLAGAAAAVGARVRSGYGTVMEQGH